MQAKYDKLNQTVTEIQLVLNTLTHQEIISKNVFDSIQTRLSTITKNMPSVADFIEHIMTKGERHYNYGAMATNAPIESKSLRYNNFTVIVTPDEQRYGK